MASTALDEQRIGFIGCGAMARALAGGLVEAGVSPSQIRAADPVDAARKGFEESTGAQTFADNETLIAEADIIVVAVKPGMVVPILEGLDRDRASELLWISIAAGVSLAGLRGALPEGARVVRTMPNTPALVGAGATAFFPGPGVGEAEIRTVEAILSAAGWCWRAPNEDLLDAVTGLSGSGPAYVFLIIEALSDAGVRQGLPREAAGELATRTVLGAAQLALETGIHPGALKDQVTSPGGTTIAGLEQLEAGGVRAALYDAVRAATARSRDLRGD